MIEPLHIHHLDAVMLLVEGVIKRMKELGIEQWDEVYPARDIIEKDLTKQQAYGYWDNEKLSAYTVLNEEYDQEYSTINWMVNGKALIIHRLMIDAASQGKGIGKKLVDFAEVYASIHGYHSIRLDAFSKNPAALHLYERKNYIKRGEVMFRKGIFYCYEKSI